MSPRLVAVVLTSALLVSAAAPHPRSNQWLQHNGPAAKALNDQYASLTSNSSCLPDRETACIGGHFANCYEGQYSIYPCPKDWACAAIPNEWSQGTTTTCDSSENISWRFSQAGISESKRSLAPTKRTNWLQQNGPAAKALNDQYASLTADSSCNDGGIACVGGDFAVCVEGRFATWPCVHNQTCTAVPNEWSSGTTTICDSSENVAWRLSQAGVSE